MALDSVAKAKLRRAITHMQKAKTHFDTAVAQLQDAVPHDHSNHVTYADTIYGAQRNIGNAIYFAERKLYE